MSDLSRLLLIVAILPISLLNGLKAKPALTEFCGIGHHLDVTDANHGCKPCPVDHFMPYPQHVQIRCYPCSHASPGTAEVETAPCTRESDTVIECRPGHYLKLPTELGVDMIKCHTCDVCSESQTEVRACGKMFNTLCCQDPSMVAILIKGRPEFTCGRTTDSSPYSHLGPAAKDGMVQHIALRLTSGSTGDSLKGVNKKPSCGEGHYLEKVDGNEICQVCDDGYYMDLKNHTSAFCYECKVNGSNPMEIWDCPDKTQRIVIGCRGPYYLWQPNEHSQNECRRCEHCEREELCEECDDGNTNPCCNQPCTMTTSSKKGNFYCRVVNAITTMLTTSRTSTVPVGMSTVEQESTTEDKRNISILPVLSESCDDGKLIGLSIGLVLSMVINVILAIIIIIICKSVLGLPFGELIYLVRTRTYYGLRTPHNNDRRQNRQEQTPMVGMD